MEHVHYYAITLLYFMYHFPFQSRYTFSLILDHIIVCLPRAYEYYLVITMHVYLTFLSLYLTRSYSFLGNRIPKGIVNHLL